MASSSGTEVPSGSRSVAITRYVGMLGAMYGVAVPFGVSWNPSTATMSWAPLPRSTNSSSQGQASL